MIEECELFFGTICPNIYLLGHNLTLMFVTLTLRVCCFDFSKYFLYYLQPCKSNNSFSYPYFSHEIGSSVTITLRGSSDTSPYYHCLMRL